MKLELKEMVAIFEDANDNNGLTILNR
ncbi:hypothetical protein LYNGBM3L_37510 [Moorena producens 3L]|uniref:Uncharacterized protein n=1 Tax=Moorena producens 3L TaxID=489825 RepID=F4XQ27_9CYAN|nr:hypothetical protein LYNGBM3L_37510 [Moorena producens 3L]